MPTGLADQVAGDGTHRFGEPTDGKQQQGVNAVDDVRHGQRLLSHMLDDQEEPEPADASHQAVAASGGWSECRPIASNARAK
jgi:hypothetical protein